MSGTGSSGTGSSSSRGRGRRTVETLSSSTPNSGSTRPAPTGSSEADKLSGVLAAVTIETPEEIGTICQRPSRGSIGTPITIKTNYFQLKIPENLVVHRYQIEVKHRVRRLDKDDHREVFWACVEANKDLFQASGFGVVYDDANCAYTLAQIRFPSKEEKNEFTFKIAKLQPRDNRAEDYEVSWKYAGSEVVRMADVARAVHKERSSISLQIIDLIVNQSRRCPMLPDFYRLWYPHNRGLFRKPTTNGVDLGGGRQLWAGYSAAGKVGENWLPLLNVDILNTAFLKTQDLLHFMCDNLNENFGRDSREPMFKVENLTRETKLRPEWAASLKKALSGIKLKTNHMRPGEDAAGNPVDRNRVYKFVDVSPSGANEITFEREGLPDMSLLEYFRENYGRELQYPALNVVRVGPKARNVYLPMEFLDIYSPQKVNKVLKDKQLAAMIRASARPADERFNMISGLVRDIRPSEDPFMLQFGLGMDEKALEVPARVLPPVRMEVAKGGRRLEAREGQWTNSPFALPAHCPGFSLISFLPERQQPQLVNFCDNQVKTCQAFGMSFARLWPDVVSYVRDRSELEAAIKRCVGESAAKGYECKLIFVIMVNRDSATYAEAKRWGDLEEGVMTQCVLEKNLRTIIKNTPGLNSATAANLALKINMKLGGVNSRIAAGDTWSKWTKATLFLGVDVTHPGVGEENKPSIGCVVGNVNLEATKWAAKLKIQQRRREHMVYVSEETRTAIVDFFTQTSVKPAHIIVYRDGVSEGQFLQVLNEEMQGIRTACLRLDANYRPKITFIVVQKRHHTRLFVKDRRQGVGRAGNVPPGTVVDRGVVHPCEFDFFLCSHLGIQGTSRPTHYYVLHDDAGFSPDDLQLLSYQLCHLFGRCNRVVSIPAPVYFADLCATRASYHLRSKLRGSDSSSGGFQATNTSSASSTALDSALTNDLRVHENLKFESYWA